MEKVAEAFGEAFCRNRLQYCLQMGLAQIAVAIEPLQDLEITLTEYQPFSGAYAQKP